MQYYNIKEFYGIQQHKDGSLLPEGTASDARNMDTSDGNLSVAKGYTKHISVIVPGADKILKLIIAKGVTDKFFVVTANNIYMFATTWVSVWTFASALTGNQIDYVQTKIGDDDYLIIATGEAQMVKVKISDGTASAFGSGAYLFDGAVQSYADKVITLKTELSAAAQAMAVTDGIYINGNNLVVISATSTTVTLEEAPSTAPQANDTAKVRGGGSDASVNFIGMFFGRIFAAGDSSAPNRLYWSAVPGDGRSIENWLAVTASEDASGGFVEIGSGDKITGLCVLSNQIVVFKQYSAYRLYGDRPSNYTVECIEPNAMSVANSSIVIKYDAPYYMTKHGIKYYNGTSLLMMDGGTKYLKEFIPDIDISQSRGAISNNVLYYSVNTAKGTYDNALIVFDAARGSYMIRDGFYIADMTVHDDILYLINDKRYVYEFNKGTDYDGVNINAYWLTQKTDFGASYYKKQAKYLSMNCTGQRFVLELLSGKSKTEYPKLIHENEDEGFVRIFVHADQARAVQLKFKNEAGSSFSICGGISMGFEAEAK